MKKIVSIALSCVIVSNLIAFPITNAVAKDNSTVSSGGNKKHLI